MSLLPFLKRKAAPVTNGDAVEQFLSFGDFENRPV